MAPGPELVVGLGGNVGTLAELRARFEAAVAGLAVRLGATATPRTAALYRSAPVGPVADQPAFLNSAAAVAVPASLAPSDVMGVLLEFEAQAGRDRTRDRAMGPRTLDLDLLAWGQRQVADLGPPAVYVPHPRLTERRFALEPLRDLLGADWVIPGTGSTVDECLGRVADQAVSRVIRSA